MLRFYLAISTGQESGHSVAGSSVWSLTCGSQDVLAGPGVCPWLGSSSKVTLVLVRIRFLSAVDAMAAASRPQESCCHGVLALNAIV